VTLLSTFPDHLSQCYPDVCGCVLLGGVTLLSQHRVSEDLSRVDTVGPGRRGSACRRSDSTRHRKVIGNDGQPFQDVPIQLEPSTGEPPRQSEVLQGDPSPHVVRDRPPILPRGRGFKSCPRYQCDVSGHRGRPNPIEDRRAARSDEPIVGRRLACQPSSAAAVSAPRERGLQATSPGRCSSRWTPG
jgi:hypothetical protein